MTSDLSARSVAARLARLRALYAPEDVEDARRRLAAGEESDRPFAVAVAARLAELRALCDLTAHLHRKRR